MYASNGKRWLSKRKGSIVHPRIVTRRGVTLTIRPVVSKDQALLEATFATLSERTRYFRFLSATAKLSSAQLRYLCEVDQTDHVAVAVLDRSRPIASGRFVRLADHPDEADVGLAVVDARQGEGVGSALISVLGEIARHRSVGRLHFDVLAENSAMLAMLAKLSGSERHDQESLVHVVVDVAAIPGPVVVSGSVAKMIDRGAAKASRDLIRSRSA